MKPDKVRLSLACDSTTSWKHGLNRSSERPLSSSGFVVRNLEGRKPDHEETKREPVNTSSEQKLAQPNLIATADEQTMIETFHLNEDKGYNDAFVMMNVQRKSQNDHTSREKETNGRSTTTTTTTTTRALAENCN
ncbi:hypothetical protein T03_11918 [Trichinella britovi]|uniref:Uncharacterized protein n=1 Tax=Trichinella britovi TaxID=45882 RepID=A0A0V1CQ33_TRIBR|nr:hypothetical protein T03_11918 [Trichinella britovi]